MGQTKWDRKKRKTVNSQTVKTMSIALGFASTNSSNYRKKGNFNGLYIICANIFVCLHYPMHSSYEDSVYIVLGWRAQS